MNPERYRKRRGIYFARSYVEGGGMVAGDKNENEDLGETNEKGEGIRKKIGVKYCIFLVY